jgi:hypothetical protein
MDPWNPETRNAFIAEAVNSDKMRGAKAGYTYKVLPKVEEALAEDPRRAAVTDAISGVLYEPKHKFIVLRFYRDLCHKLATHPYVGQEFNVNFVVTLKGSNAHVYLANALGIHNEVFKNSDTDICISINPFLAVDHFNYLKSQVEIATKQVFSQYKRALDHQLFLHRPLENDMCDPQIIKSFTDNFNTAINMLSSKFDNVIFSSPLESDEIRNKCSRNSFIITNSKSHENSVVRVEVPHFDKCERIPLRRSPLFFSFNETIDFKRDGVSKVGRFNLYRLKMNVLCESFDDEGHVTSEDKIPCDFIDVTILDRTDAELNAFWTHGMSMNIFDHDVGFWVTIPDITTVVSELKRILEDYDSCDSKKEKRMRKLELFQACRGP